jgi:membrane associated rhomboid family serine protease
MNDPNVHPLEAILTACAEAAPNPWYPSALAPTSGIPRERLDAFLDELRLGGLVRLTDWVQGKGQGYTLTPEGEEVVRNSRLLQKLSAVGVPPRPVQPALTPARPGLDTSTWDRGEQVRAVLLNPTRPVVTSAIFLVNVLFFLAGLALAYHQNRPINDYLAGNDQKAINATGAVNILQILDGQWWRLLTSVFVHIGLLHLGVNMYALYIFGPLVERMFGHWRYLLLYLVAGFGGSCVAVWFQSARDLTAGASGAICGLLGAFATWTFLNRHYMPPQLVRAWMRNVMINTFLLILISVMPNISWSGHLGGAVFGMLAAALLNYQMVHRGWLRWLALAGILILPLLAHQFVVRYPKPEIRFQYYQHKVEYYRDMASRVHNSAWKLYREDLRPLQGKPRRKPLTPTQAEQVLSRIDKVLTELHQTADSLTEGETALPTSMADRVKAFKGYVEAWIAVLTKFQTVVREGRPWNEKDEKELNKYFQKMLL